MNTKFRFLIGLFAISILTCIVLSGVLAYITHKDANEYTAGVSVSTRQKAQAFELGQKLTLLYNKSQSDAISQQESSDIRNMIFKWEMAQKALVNGNEAYGTANQKSADFVAKLQLTALPFVNVTERVNQMLEKEGTWNFEDLKFVVDNIQLYTDGMNDVTGQLNKESDEVLMWRFYQFLFLSLITLIVGVLGFFILLKPVLKKGEEAEEIKQVVAQELERYKTSRSEFLTNFAHEVKAPLDGLTGMSDLLAQTSLNEEQGRYIRSIKASASHLHNIVNEIVDHTKLDAGEFQIEKFKFDLQETLHQVADLMKATAAEKRLELITDVDPSVPEELIQDERRIRQVLIHLLGNAIKYTSQGEVILKSEVLNAEGDFIQLKFSVSDTGIGMDEVSKRRVFESFQNDQSSSGLNLSIAKRLVSGMGGRIWIDSAVGSGTTVSFTVIGEVAGGLDLTKVNLLSGKKVLVVDGNKTTLKVLVKQLSVWGVQAIPFNSPELVTDMIDNLTKFDFAIIDHQIPAVDGMTLLDRIRLKYDASELPVIVFSNNSLNLLQSEAFEVYLTKPVRQSALLEAILKVLKMEKEVANRGNHEGSFSKNNLKILIAHDNDFTRAITERNLQILGHKCVSVNNGMDVVEQGGKGKFDLLLVDTDLPGMNGVDAVQKLRKITHEDDLPLIFGLSDSGESEKKKLLKQGMDEVIDRKAEVDVIQKKIEEWFASSN